VFHLKPGTPPLTLHPHRRRRGKGGHLIADRAGRVLTGRASAMPRRAREMRRAPGRAISASVVAMAATVAAMTSGKGPVAVRRTTSAATASTASPSAPCFPSKR